MPDRAIMALLQAVKHALLPGDPPPPADLPPWPERGEREIAAMKSDVRHEGRAVVQCARALGRVLERKPVEEMGAIIDLVERGGRRA